MGWAVDDPATAVLLAGNAQIRVLANGLPLDFPHVVPFDFWRCTVVASLPGFGPHSLSALLDTLALIPQFPVVLPPVRLAARRQ